MRVAIRVDGSSKMGWGHVIRCLALGETLAARGSSVDWVASELPPELAGWLASRGIGVHFSSAKLPVRSFEWHSDAEAIGATIGQEGARADWLIVDHYGLDERWEAATSRFADRILAIDDLANRRHSCAVLLDQTPGRSSADYVGLVPKGCRLLMGPQWALLRSQFAARRRAAVRQRAQIREVRRILVNLGGSDFRQLLEPVVRGIARSGVGTAVDVLIGTDRPELAGLLKEWAGKEIEVNALANVEDVAELMAQAHIAIGAAGTSSLERCALGLPSLLIVVAENQRGNARALDACGAARYLCDWQEATAEKIAAEVARLAGNADRLRTMATASSRVCDGRGVDRVHLALVGAMAATSGREVTLRLAERGDEQLMHRWQSHPATRRYARNPAVPTPEEHHDWLARVLENPEALLMIVEEAGNPVGVLRLDQLNEHGEHEVSIFVAPDKARRGIGFAALRLADRLAPGWTLRAEVLPGNEASHRLFGRAGYERVAPTTFVRKKLEG